MQASCFSFSKSKRMQMTIRMQSDRGAGAGIPIRTELHLLPYCFNRSSDESFVWGLEPRDWTIRLPGSSHAKAALASRRNLFVQRHRFVIKTSSSSHGGHLNLERLDRLEKCCSSANEGKKKEAQRKRLHGDFCVGVWVLEGGSVLLYYVKNLPT
jgi:hypothetical protein